MDTKRALVPVHSGERPPVQVLFVTASIGSGHHQVQLAVQEALLARGVPIQSRESDATEYLTPADRWWTVGLYAFELRYAPWLYAWFYRTTDHDRPFSIIGTCCRWVGLGGMRRDLAQVQPEVVVHSYWSSVPLAHTVRRRKQTFLNALIVTDYRAHRHWIRPEAELIMVASQETANQMLERGADPDTLVVTGIPIARRYRDLLGADRAALRRKHGLRTDQPLILLSTGGTGSYLAQTRVLHELGNLGRPVQVLMLAGAAEPGVEQLGGATVYRFGFTTAFPELMAAADLVVGKAGGLTVAESSALGVPMIVHAPIPGQEEYNASYLERGGAALWARELRELRPAILRALDPGAHARLSANARALSVPDAADRVAGEILRRLQRV
ncbi:glycosyltransferase [Deinococcus sp. QL22]|uniref:MGDG synthase family glycosyltransferase n=1 Tax=Deinococcus sp. QL22 TaxID=2939437 RepID=UPI0020182DE7|nr:glycosyltransferase [Deinococcus sp. QL22]UQN08668.1 UDP-N-acetylglucosamine--LPS N-acetylglucosamine transferase [Deinococcus sp. QL22]